jgi:hypothetical protein
MLLCLTLNTGFPEIKYEQVAAVIKAHDPGQLAEPRSISGDDVDKHEIGTRGLRPSLSLEEVLLNFNCLLTASSVKA